MKIEHFEEARIWWENRQEIEEDGFPKAKKYTNKELTDLGYNIDLCGYPHEEEEILAPKDLIARYEEKRASLNAEIDSVLADITSFGSLLLYFAISVNEINSLTKSYV